MPERPAPPLAELPSDQLFHLAHSDEPQAAQAWEIFRRRPDFQEVYARESRAIQVRAPGEQGGE